MELLNYTHCVVGANLHLQFMPAYRRDIFCDSEVIMLCRAVFGVVAKELGVEMVACEFGPDHVHLFLSGWKNEKDPWVFTQIDGSYAQRVPGRLSDIDLAIHYGGTPEERFRFRMAAAGLLGDRFDVQIFQDLPLYIQNEVVTKGKVLYRRSYKQMFSEYLRCIREYGSFRKYPDYYYAALERA